MHCGRRAATLTKERGVHTVSSAQVALEEAAMGPGPEGPCEVALAERPDRHGYLDGLTDDEARRCVASCCSGADEGVGVSLESAVI
jgi:hypothetical protein